MTTIAVEVGKLGKLGKLAWSAISRGFGLAGALGLVVTLTCVSALTANAVRESLTKGDPLQYAQRIVKLLGHWLPADVVVRVGELPALSLIVGFTLLALAPLLAAGFAAKLDPQRANAFVRTAAAFVATMAVAIFAVTAASALTGMLIPGAVTARRLVQFCQLTGVALLASLPFATVAAVVRSAWPGQRLGPYLALAAALAVRYGLPLLIANREPLRWLSPRSYELAMLSSSLPKMATAAVLCVGWSLALLALAAGIARVGSRLSSRALTSRHPSPTIEQASRAEVS